MIDFEKLKLAHVLCYYSGRYYFDLTLGMHDMYFNLYDLCDPKNDCIYEAECLEELLSKIQELLPSSIIQENPLEKRLIQIESKLSELDIRTNAIKSLINSKFEGEIKEFDAKYARSEECQHERDGAQYRFIIENNLVKEIKHKCKKCGEFYQ